MKTRTTIEAISSTIELTHSDTLVALGSCFAQRIGQRLSKYKFRGSVNPCGTIFNPISIARLLTPISADLDIARQDYIERDGRWLSYHHHSDIISSSPAALHEHTTQLQQQLMSDLAAAKVLLLTLGTSFVYQLKRSNEVVANCHKQPSELFERKLLSTQDIYTALESIVTHTRALNPTLQIIITVSPVRHTRDTLVLNSRSKAHLLTTAHQLTDNYDHVSYFPAYELLMDDLRDYRYYADDMIHPSDMAVSYVWDVFRQAYLTRDTQLINKELDKLYSAVGHRPFNADSEQHQRFIDQAISHAANIAEQHALDLSEEVDQLRRSSLRQ